MRNAHGIETLCQTAEYAEHQPNQDERGSFVDGHEPGSHGKNSKTKADEGVQSVDLVREVTDGPLQEQTAERDACHRVNDVLLIEAERQAEQGTNRIEAGED